tara:strand:- start:4923 stop:5219 length:297 start_codon:yes stop_codon:yes gene_type:complete
MSNDESRTYIGRLKKDDVDPNCLRLTVPDVPFFYLLGTRERLGEIAEPILAEMIYRNREAGFPIPEQVYRGVTKRLEDAGITNFPINATPRPNAINQI